MNLLISLSIFVQYIGIYKNKIMFQSIFVLLCTSTFTREVSVAVLILNFVIKSLNGNMVRHIRIKSITFHISACFQQNRSTASDHPELPGLPGAVPVEIEQLLSRYSFLAGGILCSLQINHPNPYGQGLKLVLCILCVGQKLQKESQFSRLYIVPKNRSCSCVSFEKRSASLKKM